MDGLRMIGGVKDGWMDGEGLVEFKMDGWIEKDWWS